MAGQAEAGVLIAGLFVANWLSLNREKWAEIENFSKSRERGLGRQGGTVGIVPVRSPFKFSLP